MFFLCVVWYTSPYSLTTPRHYITAERHRGLLSSHVLHTYQVTSFYTTRIPLYLAIIFYVPCIYTIYVLLTYFFPKLFSPSYLRLHLYPPPNFFIKRRKTTHFFIQNHSAAAVEATPCHEVMKFLDEFPNHFVCSWCTEAVTMPPPLLMEYESLKNHRVLDYHCVCF